MANPTVLTVSDTEPDLVCTLYNANTVQDLTNATVTLNLRLTGSANTQTFATELSSDPTDGTVAVNRGYLSAVAAGLYAAEYRVTFSDGSVGTWPTPGHLDLKFVARRT